MKKLFMVFLVLATIVTGLIYLLSCLTPYINPIRFWPMTFIALGFPAIAVVLLILIVIWLLLRRNIGLLLLLLLCLGYKNITSTLALHAFSKFTYDKDSTSLRILSWNVRYFDTNDRKTSDSIRRKMFDFIKGINADVILFQDYLEYDSPLFVSNRKILQDSFGYKYAINSNDFTTEYSHGRSWAGSAIFSRLPFIDTGKVLYKNIVPESITYADLLFRNKKLRVFTTHLMSMSIKPHPGIRNHPGVEKLDNAYHFTKTVSQTLKVFDQVHSTQAEFLKDVLAKSPYPSIITGDFNSVPSSYVYHTIKGNRQDAFTQKGFGLGHSYYALSETLRIDYILPDKSFKVVQVTTPQVYLSDHFPVIADITWAR